MQVWYMKFAKKTIDIITSRTKSAQNLPPSAGGGTSPSRTHPLGQQAGHLRLHRKLLSATSLYVTHLLNGLRTGLELAVKVLRC